MDNSLNILNINCALEKIKIIDRVSITKSDLTKVIDYFDEKKLDKFNNVNYYLFNEKYFDNLLNKSVKITKFFINKIRQNFI